MKIFGSRVGSQAGTHGTRPFQSWPGPLHSIKWFLPSSSVNTSSDTLVFVWVTFCGVITIWNYLISLSQQLGSENVPYPRTKIQNVKRLRQIFNFYWLLPESSRTVVSKTIVMFNICDSDWHCKDSMLCSFQRSDACFSDSVYMITGSSSCNFVASRA